MSDAKILQALLEGQQEIKKSVQENRDALVDLEERITKRIDKLGLQVAELSDDAPTNEEFDVLADRVTSLEGKLARN